MSGIGTWLQPHSRPHQPPLSHHPQQPTGMSHVKSDSSNGSNARGEAEGSKGSSGQSVKQASPAASSPFHKVHHARTPGLSVPSLRSSPLVGDGNLLGWVANSVAAVSKVFEQVGG